MVLKKENSPSSVSSRRDVPSEAPTTTTTAAESSKAKKSRRRCKCFGLWRRKTKLVPLQKDERDKRTHQKPQESNETQVDDSQEPGHQEVWLGSFMDIVRCHHSVDVLHKLQVLLSFKDIISVHAQEFQDISQKDAHEFLTSVLDQMRDLTPLLSETAAMLGLTYNCPVREHLVFKMQNTRMCNSCGFSSMTFEDFTHLSLNLLPGASVQEMLEEYLTETELEYRCDCGASTSWQQYRFVTLPRVLILHVKRFHFTPLLHLVKLCHPILLFRELMLTSSQANVWYTLVSVISHLGPGGNAGHYISDGVHPEVDVFDPADRWLSYNDSIVTETTGATVFKKCMKTAYILFYQRQVVELRITGTSRKFPSSEEFIRRDSEAGARPSCSSSSSSSSSSSHTAQAASHGFAGRL
ncbi:Ubiquitin carboxyl-terminal hydrolase 37 [Channa argus]|uniref:Ubiquitin carboxyl-terminal hydrolase 37 n=1 Tax=Channa argus TaxID=215402 RepID=A0A6G1QMM9_CHAAH|nr:Ubiquitin carboxyl-terminal hydrolase 37 [Channa argus]